MQTRSRDERSGHKKGGNESNTIISENECQVTFLTGDKLPNIPNKKVTNKNR